MARKRVSLAYISNDTARKTTYKKRKRGLFKKANELATLCGIQACAVVLSSYESTPEVWPDSRGAQQAIARFQRTLGRDETRNLNQESFTRQRIAKVNARLNKQRSENQEKVTAVALFQCVKRGSIDDKTIVDTEAIDRLARENICSIKKKMEEII